MASTPIQSQARTDLEPSFVIPLVLLFGAIPVFFLQMWVGLAIAVFGVFLMVQTAIIKLSFTATALEVYRGSKLIRSFPYTEWQNWRIFWEPAPILFYFKEVKSIHFLPIIFDPGTLKACLERHCPLQSLRPE
ncbi:DUF3119 family protein [Synechocystis salina LEGE 06155]|uniref:DUF3119 family protein n=2 Tax=Synechocystis TaxID=1142 RepID=A0ABR9VNC2_9SYNC|nr:MULTISPECIES: DUF3119 family protein [Synechocystis]MBD2652909.1 DUF3119 family protein [Synechocystis sp. FACHB-383]MBE9174265.1 DUF3119 family protein [Synechocystis salina LEGE 06155]MBE9240435.1 DUF3119 family protein [Synechocystis salina LEGE 00041]MBE9252857.1 DUF3119 family protein [Synechocystis salina LEGE 00031]